MGEILLWLLLGSGLCLLAGWQLLRRRSGARRAAEHAERAAAEQAQAQAEQQAEEQRLAAERAAAERSAADKSREAAEQAERQRAAALEAERQAQRLVAQQAAAAAEARRQAELRAEERLAAERAEADRAEAERIAAERRREAAAQAERARLAARAAELEAQRLAAEQAAREAQAKAQAAHLAERQAAEQRAAAERRAVKTAAQTLVMVADDSKVVRIKTGRLLAQHQYQVAYASDGLDAVQQMQLKLPDVLITDVEMPGLDGFELTRQLRADPRTAMLPVIMITAADDRHREQADAAGVSVLLGKPYPEDALLAHIRRAMGQDGDAAQAGRHSRHGALDALA